MRTDSPALNTATSDERMPRPDHKARKHSRPARAKWTPKPKAARGRFWIAREAPTA